MNFTAAPSSPSPTTSSPDLTQSISNSSSSPPLFTPPRQPKPRYPDLGRVPLHRRGTSQTYERLEDLLREAGYKETRVFTPESERLESQKHSNDAHSNGKKQGVGATVVGFLTGLVTGGATTTTQSRQQPTPDGPPYRHPQLPRAQSPSSPLADRQPQRQEASRSAESSEPHTPIMTSSIESLDDQTPKALRRYPHQPPQRPPSRPTTPGANASAAYPAYYNQHQYHAPLATQQQHRLSAAQRSLQKQASRSSFQTHTSFPSSSAMNASSDQGTIPSVNLNDNNNNTANGAHQPQPSRAGAYLRHMVSTPTINAPPRPKSTPVRAHHHPRKRTIHEDSDGTDAESTATVQPPLPRKWLDTVAKALLLGAAITPLSSPPSPTQPNHNANIPSSSSSLHPDHQQRVLRQTRSSLSQTTLARSSKPTMRRSGLLDQTNVSIHTVLNPPALFTRLERGRAPSSQSVLKVQVVCRSAPGSRTSSLARQDSMIGDSRRARGDKPGSGTGKSPRRQQSTGAKAAGRVKGNRRNHKKQGEEKTRVPSLTQTRIEGDVWHIVATAHSRRNNTHPNKRSKSKDKLRPDYFSDGDYLHDPENDDEFYASDYDEDEDEDEGELDLARMLTHPKRQNSIRSLRKHLHSQLASPSVTDVSSTHTTTKPHPLPHPGPRKGSVGGGRLSSGGQFRLGGMEEETDETGVNGGQWGHQWRKGGPNSRKASEDEEAEGFPWLRDSGSKSGSRRSTTTKVRSPGPWVNSNASTR